MNTIIFIQEAGLAWGPSETQDAENRRIVSMLTLGRPRSSLRCSHGTAVANVFA